MLIKKVLVIYVILQVVDLLFTSIGLIILTNPNYNPLTLLIYDKRGLIGWVLDKIILTLIILFLLSKIEKYKKTYYLTMVVLFIISFGAISDTLLSLDIINELHYSNWVPDWITRIFNKIFNFVIGWVD